MMDDSMMAQTERNIVKLTSIAIPTLISDLSSQKKKQQQENYISDTVCSGSNVSWPLNRLQHSKHLMRKGFHSTV